MVFVGVLRRNGRFEFELVVTETFRPEVTGDKQADLLAAVTRANQALERLIRLAPEQYLWIHDRYRTQPAAVEGEAAQVGGEKGEEDAISGEE